MVKKLGNGENLDDSKNRDFGKISIGFSNFGFLNFSKK